MVWGKPKGYEMKALCYNCGKDFQLIIPYGVSVDEFLDEYKEAVCVNCGCDNIKVTNKYGAWKQERGGGKDGIQKKVRVRRRR